MTALSGWTMEELLERCPEAVEVLAGHGVNPLTRCPKELRSRLTLKQLLGRTCAVDDVEATLADLKIVVGRGEA